MSANEHNATLDYARALSVLTADQKILLTNNDQLGVGILYRASRYFEAHCGLVVIKDQLYRHDRQTGGDMQRMRSAVSHIYCAVLADSNDFFL